MGIVDHIEVTIPKCIDHADMIVIAVPVGSMPEVFEHIAPHLKKGMVVTDVGSVKTSITKSARNALAEHFRFFVPGHPLAGIEQSGLSASSENLFHRRRVVLTPNAETDTRAVEQVSAMWRAAGADVVSMPAEDHDRLLAASSHLPHILAVALMDMIRRRDDSQAVLACTAGGFHDVTRIVASDPVMWRDICLDNREELLKVLQDYRNDLAKLSDAIKNGKEEALLDLFSHAQRARQALNEN
jgi:prephenate dehydrogenase